MTASSPATLAEVNRFPPELSWKHFQRSREEAVFALVEGETSEIGRLIGDLRPVLARFDGLSAVALRLAPPEGLPSDLPLPHRRGSPRQGAADLRSGRRQPVQLLRRRIRSPEAIEAATDLDDPEIIQRLAAVYDRAEELLQKRLTRRVRSGRRSAGDRTET